MQLYFFLFNNRSTELALSEEQFVMEPAGAGQRTYDFEGVQLVADIVRRAHARLGELRVSGRATSCWDFFHKFLRTFKETKIQKKENEVSFFSRSWSKRPV